MTQKVFFQRNKTEAATVCGQGGDGKQEGMGWGVGGEWLNLLVPLISVTFLAGKVSPSRPNERTLSLCRGCMYIRMCMYYVQYVDKSSCVLVWIHWMLTCYSESVLTLTLTPFSLTLSHSPLTHIPHSLSLTFLTHSPTHTFLTHSPTLTHSSPTLPLSHIPRSLSHSHIPRSLSHIPRSLSHCHTFLAHSPTLTHSSLTHSHIPRSLSHSHTPRSLSHSHTFLAHSHTFLTHSHIPHSLFHTLTLTLTHTHSNSHSRIHSLTHTHTPLPPHVLSSCVLSLTATGQR